MINTLPILGIIIIITIVTVPITLTITTVIIIIFTTTVIAIITTTIIITTIIIETTTMKPTMVTTISAIKTIMMTPRTMTVYIGDITDMRIRSHRIGVMINTSHKSYGMTVSHEPLDWSGRVKMIKHTKKSKHPRIYLIAKQMFLFLLFL